MRPLIKLSKHSEAFTQESLLQDRRISHFNNLEATIWKGSKRYAH